MMLERVCECCGQKELIPYPPERYDDAYARMDFERRWDAKVKAGKERER